MANKNLKSDTWLIVGLGNPGSEYAQTRHNVGHMVIAELSKRLNQPLKSFKNVAYIAEGRLGVKQGGVPGEKVIVATLKSYMNTSGGPLKSLCNYFDIDLHNRVIVVHDELDIPEFSLKMKQGGGEGGHNGLRSITSAVGSRDYGRLRVGIGRPPAKMDTADYVLSNFPKASATNLAIVVREAADTIEDIVNDGFIPTQQKLHASQ